MTVIAARTPNRRGRNKANEAPLARPIEPGMTGGHYHPLTQIEMEAFSSHPHTSSPRGRGRMLG
mgnify:CR=1 FL=1